jgi:hypothetical protein
MVGEPTRTDQQSGSSRDALFPSSSSSPSTTCDNGSSSLPGNNGQHYYANWHSVNPNLDQKDPQMRKRRRLSSDVDGESSPGAKKKRRLGLVLITSRLSPPFSIPATYIVSRGTSKIAVWARQRQNALGRGSLMKAAIMNWVRRRGLSLRDGQPWYHEMAMTPLLRRLLFNSSVVLPSSLAQQLSSPNAVAPHHIFSAGSERDASGPVGDGNHLILSGPLSRVSEQHVSGTRPLQSAGVSGAEENRQSSPPGTPRRQYIPLPSSPLCLTNYDYSIFDNEDDYFESGGDGEDVEIGHNNLHGHGPGLIYSDFNDIGLEPSEPILDDHDALAAFDSLLFWNRWTHERGEPMVE